MERRRKTRRHNSVVTTGNTSMKMLASLKEKILDGKNDLYIFFPQLPLIASEGAILLRHH